MRGYTGKRGLPAEEKGKPMPHSNDNSAALSRAISLQEIHRPSPGTLQSAKPLGRKELLYHEHIRRARKMLSPG